MRYVTADASGTITNTGFAQDAATARLQVKPGESLYAAPDDAGFVDNTMMKVERGAVVSTAAENLGSIIWALTEIPVSQG